MLGLRGYASRLRRGMIGLVNVVVRVLSLALAFAVSAVPVMYDGCLMTCQGSGPASHVGAEHACHHSTGSLGVAHRLSDQARPCSHEHGQAATLSDDARVDTPVKATTRTAVTTLAVTTTLLTLNARIEWLAAGPPPISQPGTVGLVLPLRI